MVKKKGLTHQEIAFCYAYVKYGKKQKAVLAAYPEYADKTRAAITSKYQNLMKNKDIVEYLDKIRSEILTKHMISADRVLAEYAKIGFCRGTDILDDNGNIMQVSDWPGMIKQSVSSLKIRKSLTDKDTDIIEVKFWPKTKALEALGKHLGLFEKDNEQKNNGLSELADVLRSIDSGGLKPPGMQQGKDKN